MRELSSESVHFHSHSGEDRTVLARCTQFPRKLTRLSCVPIVRVSAQQRLKYHGSRVATVAVYKTRRGCTSLHIQRERFNARDLAGRVRYVLTLRWRTPSNRIVTFERAEPQIHDALAERSGVVQRAQLDAI
jgi:hypothetical protein